MHGRGIGLAVLLALACAGQHVFGQSADTLRPEVRLLVDGLTDARALSADPAGTVYTADAGRNVIVRVRLDGQLLAPLGGPGSGSGQFAELTDVDATSGLLIATFDAGNERVDGFSGEFMPLWQLQPGADGSGRATTQAAEGLASPGALNGDNAFWRPVSLAVSPQGHLFVLDADSRQVWHWDEQRRLVGRLGSAAQESGGLVEPVALAVGGRGALYVADRGAGVVQVYDALGNYSHALGAAMEGLINVSAAGDYGILVSAREGVRWFERDVLRAVIQVPTEGDPRDALMSGGRLYVLAARTLYVADINEKADP